MTAFGDVRARDESARGCTVANESEPWCGLPAKPELEGQSLAALLKDPAHDWEQPAITTYLPNNHAIRSDRWRYIRYADGSQELYDLEKDPNEWSNLAGDAKNAEVIRQHARWLPKVNAPAEKDPGNIP